MNDLPSKHSDTACLSWFAALEVYLQASFERAVVIISGEKQGCFHRARQLSTQFSGSGHLIVSDQLASAVSPRQARTQLGQEYDLIIFDAREAFDLDALGAVSGTLCGGGVLLLLLPELDDDLFENNAYLQLIRPVLLQHPAVYHLQEGGALRAIPQVHQMHKKPLCEAPFLNHQQQQLVAHMTASIKQKRNRPMVLVADRGRGKSSALGLMAGRLLAQGTASILVTAPRLSISEQLFFHGARMLDGPCVKPGYLASDLGEMRFIAPDALLMEKPEADVLIVDEAAAIPLPMLVKMLKRYPQIIFASTVYGYEGTGQGFVLKFSRILDEMAAGWENLSLQTPVRWAANDPLEDWINDVLYLHTELYDIEDYSELDQDEISLELLDRDSLLNNRGKIAALFALLISAHYRSRPSDFQFLLNEASVRIYVLSYHQKILAALVINQEGGFDDELAAAIYRGERRPPGHLLPQTLSFHGGCEAAATSTYGRIMRIAVHPDLQGRGLGSRLVEAVVRQESARGYLIGTSFAATAELLRFWRRLDFACVRLGFSRDHVSGGHSVVMLRRAESGVYMQLVQRFRLSISYWLEHLVTDIDGELKKQLLLGALEDNAELSELDWQDIRSFAHHLRGYEACSWALFKLSRQYSDKLDSLSSANRQLMIEAIQKNYSWPVLVQRLALSGKKQLIKKLRESVARLIE